MEGVLDVDGNVLAVDGIDGRGVDDLRAEVAEFRGLGVGEFVDGIGVGNDARVGGHEAVHVGPDFKSFGIERSGEEGGGIVRTAAAEVGGHAGSAVGRDEAAHDGHGREGGEGFADEFRGQFDVGEVLLVLREGLHELARVEVLCALDEFGRDERREAFAVGNDGVGRLRREVLDEAHAVENAAQFGEQRIEPGDERCLLPGRDDGLHHGVVAVGDRIEFVEVSRIAFRGELRGADELVRHAAEGRNHHHDRVGRGFYNGLHVGYAFGSAYGTPAEFQYIHGSVFMDGWPVGRKWFLKVRVSAVAYFMRTGPRLARTVGIGGLDTLVARNIPLRASPSPSRLSIRFAVCRAR